LVPLSLLAPWRLRGLRGFTAIHVSACAVNESFVTRTFPRRRVGVDAAAGSAEATEQAARADPAATTPPRKERRESSCLDHIWSYLLHTGT
jgi:hypothetical protein